MSKYSALPLLPIIVAGSVHPPVYTSLFLDRCQYSSIALCSEENDLKED